MSRFGLSEEQAKAILEMRLRRLTAMERDEIEQELATLRAEIARLVHLIENEDALKELIRQELVLVRDQYSDERRTQIVADAASLNLEDLIPREDMVVTVTNGGYIKRVPLSEYDTQNRGGRGKSGMSTKDNDFVEHLFVASSHSYLLFFTDRGQVFKSRVFELPTGSRQARGKPLNNVLALQADERLSMVLPIDDFEEGKSVFFATAKGKIKKTDLMLYRNVRVNGIRAINLGDDDRLIAVRLVEPGQHIMLATKKCQVIRFEESQARSLGRTASGVRGIKFKLENEGDEVVGCINFNPELEEELSVMTITARGMGKRTLLSEFRVQSRGGSGLRGIKPRIANGDVVGIILVESDTDEYLVVTTQGVIIRSKVSGVKVIGRLTVGVRLMRVPKGVEVISVARYASAPDEEALEEDESALEGEELEGDELDELDELEGDDADDEGDDADDDADDADDADDEGDE
jgi:DNA gyrase subunit A